MLKTVAYTAATKSLIKDCAREAQLYLLQQQKAALRERDDPYSGDVKMTGYMCGIAFTLTYIFCALTVLYPSRGVGYVAFLVAFVIFACSVVPFSLTQTSDKSGIYFSVFFTCMTGCGILFTTIPLTTFLMFKHKFEYEQINSSQTAVLFSLTFILSYWSSSYLHISIGAICSNSMAIFVVYIIRNWFTFWHTLGHTVQTDTERVKYLESHNAAAAGSLILSAMAFIIVGVAYVALKGMCKLSCCEALLHISANAMSNTYDTASTAHDDEFSVWDEESSIGNAALRAGVGGGARGYGSTTTFASSAVVFDAFVEENYFGEKREEEEEERAGIEFTNEFSPLVGGGPTVLIAGLDSGIGMAGQTDVNVAHQANTLLQQQMNKKYTREAPIRGVLLSLLAGLCLGCIVIPFDAEFTSNTKLNDGLRSVSSIGLSMLLVSLILGMTIFVFSILERNGVCTLMSSEYRHIQCDRYTFYGVCSGVLLTCAIALSMCCAIMLHWPMLSTILALSQVSAFFYFAVGNNFGLGMSPRPKNWRHFVLGTVLILAGSLVIAFYM